MAVIVTKLGAASRQLDTAINLFFSGNDAVSVHALAVAAANVFADIAEHQNAGVSWRTRIREDAGLSRKELKSILHNEWDFFKHADRDPDATLQFNELTSEDFIFMAVLECGDLQPTTCPMQAFQIWYIAAHPERFPVGEPIFDDARQALPGISQLKHSVQIERGAAFLKQHCGGIKPNEREDISMGDTMDKVDHREPLAFGRLLVRSALLGLIVPVTQGEFWEVKVIQVVSALVVCLILYGLEKAILWPLRKRLSIRPLHSAAYRGALLYALLTFDGSPAGALGAGLVSGLIAMGLFKLEDRIINKFVKRNGAGPSRETSSDK